MLKKIFLSLLIISLVSTFFAISSAQEPPESFRVLCHAVHKNVATVGQGGDITPSWLNQTGVKNIDWLTLATGPLHERFYREATLPQTDVDVFYLLNTFATPQVANMLEPLDDYLKSDPIEGFPEDFPKGMVDAITFNGKLYGIPIRHATSSFHYNEELFKERGLEGPPTTVEEFYDYAKKLTYTRSDGSKVYGFVFDTVSTVGGYVTLARAWDGDILTTDYKVVCNEPPMVKAITILRDFYLEGVWPSVSIDSAEMDRWMQTGRAAMTMTGIGRNIIYNNPDLGSQFPGKIKAAPIPVSKELTGYEMGPTKTEFWCMTIPKNAKNKDLSWSFIKYLSTKESALAMALNGNGPTRLSVYDDPIFKSKTNNSDLECKLLQTARVPFPAFEKSAEGQDVALNEIQAALLGVKTPQQAMDDLAEELERLLKESGL